MFRILIVDDEFYIRDGLANAVNWESIGAAVAGQAASGLEALAKVPLVNPDIVITDIRMEDMDGLTFAENVRKERPEIKVIFLSGYDDFSYAQRAIRLGATGYILKPGAPDEIIETVKQAIDIIEAERSEEKYKAELTSGIYKTQETHKNYFAERLINGNITKAEALEQAAMLGWHNLDGFCVSVAVLDGFYDTELAEDAKKLYTDLQLVLGTLISNAPPHVLHAHIYSCSLVVISGFTSAEIPDPAAYCIKGAQQFQKLLADEHGLVCSVSVGQSVDCVSLLSLSYSKAKSQLDFKMLFGSRCIIHQGNAPFAAKFVYPKTLEAAILDGIKNRSRQDVRAATTAFVKELASRQYSKTQFKAALSELYAVVNRRVMPSDIDLYQLYEQKWLDPYYVLECYDSLEEIEIWLTTLFCEVVNRLENSKAVNAKKIVNQVHEFIHCNYSNPELSLTMLADYVFLNSAYLSRRYKKETGSNYVEYLINYRMREAKRLLKDSSLRISDVSTMVGYPNTQYFCTLFKKFSGISPMEYREKNEGI